MKFSELQQFVEATRLMLETASRKGEEYQDPEVFVRDRQGHIKREIVGWRGQFAQDPDGLEIELVINI